MQGNPLKINDAFGHLISNKVVDSLATKKQEVSAKIFTDKVESDPVPIEEPEVEVQTEPQTEPEIQTEPPAESTETQT